MAERFVLIERLKARVLARAAKNRHEYVLNHRPDVEKE
jgi:hypothetical protein